ncbi:hypothetical protein ACFQ4K_24830 [Tistrella bauzanensis]
MTASAQAHATGTDAGPAAAVLIQDRPRNAEIDGLVADLVRWWTN